MQTQTQTKQAKDIDTKAAKRARDKANAAAANTGVGMIQSFFFNKKPAAPAPAPTPPAAAAAAAAKAARSAAAARRGRGNGDGDNNNNGRRDNGRSATSRSRGAGGLDDESHKLIEGAIPTECASISWEGYLHHVDFIVALMHVGTSLIPKSLMKVSTCFVGCVGVKSVAVLLCAFVLLCRCVLGTIRAVRSVLYSSCGWLSAIIRRGSTGFRIELHAK